jgi:Tol biopolymer transport system component
MRRVRAAAAAALVWALAPAAASAQYFGRNKVRYDSFDFEVLKTEHFDVYHYPEERAATEAAARMAERWYTRLSRLLNHSFTRRQPLVLYANHAHFEQTNALMGMVGEGTGGATEVLKRRIVMPFAGPLGETDHVLGHELVHAFQFDITAGRGGLPYAIRLPLWFVEGMAEYLSVGPVDPHTAMWLRDAAHHGKLPAVKDLDDPRFFPYRYGQALWSYIAGRYGDETVGRVLRASMRTPDAVEALEEALGVDEKVLTEGWHQSIRAAYGPFLEGKEEAARFARPLLTDENAGEVNIGPALSPDGRRVAFLSEKNLFAIEMFVADTATGRVHRRIVKRAADPHFDSLQFIRSSGGWDRASRRFVFAALRKGQPVLTVLDVDRGRTEREVALRDLGEIFDPTFSPDGRQVAFSANVGGVLDLFVYDLARGSLRRLTEDHFAELQPAFSPDGRRLAFATDRFTSSLAKLDFGAYRLAVLDLEGEGPPRELPGFADAKNIDPQWSDDGGALFFLSDHGGITNVHRLELATGQIRQVTDLVTGVSGITAASPALSAGGGKLAFSVYEDGRHAIYLAEDGAVLAGKEPGAAGRRASTLPPVERARPEVPALVADAGFGLPKALTFPSDDYRARLQLDYMGQTGVTVGADSYGTYVGGGVSFLFSDMLGNHNLGVLVQAQGDIQDLGFVAQYENRKSRWSWGGLLQQVPYTTGRFSTFLTEIDEQAVIIEEADIFREVHRAAAGYAAYPFSRVTRAEVSAAGRLITFGRELRQRAFEPTTGQFLGEREQELESDDALKLVEMGAALVHDTSVFGATSPILGRRYRLEASPNLGDLNFTGVLADFRQYVMPVRPFTLAGRLMHYGRYGRDGETDRLQPLFIGYPTLVRGYDVDTFDADECPVDPEGACPVFDQLLGSRVLVANLELRFPLFALFGAKNLYGPVPLEMLAFADAGVAWTRENEARFLGGERAPVRSFGFGARANLFGFAVVEMDFARPLDRPGKGWIWQFSLAPGF